jgi:hypothetical protein
VRLARLSPICLFLALAGCVNYPETYAPPIQRLPMSGRMESPIKHFVHVNDPKAELYFVRDIRPLEDDSYRWTGKNPTFRFVLDSTKDLKFLMDFMLHGDTMKVTGPLTFTYTVNGNLLDRVTYREPGPQLFEKPVDESWLIAGGETIVTVELDKVYVAEADGVQLGFTLTRVGFIE